MLARFRVYYCELRIRHRWQPITMPLTHKSIQSLPPGRTPYRKYNGGTDPGFGIQVMPLGHKQFNFAYRTNGRRWFMALGT